MRNLISRAKNAGLSPEAGAGGVAEPARDARRRSCTQRYQARLSTFNAVDFDDLIRLPVQLLESDEDRAPGLARAHRLPAGRRVPGHQRRAVPPAQGAGRRRAARSPASATTTSRSTPGAAPTPTTCCSWRATIRRCRSSSWSRTTAARNRMLRAANALIAHNPHEYPEDAVERPGRRRAHPRLGMPRRRARGREASRARSHFLASRQAGAVERFLHPVPRQPPVARAGEGAAAAARAVPPVPAAPRSSNAPK